MPKISSKMREVIKRCKRSPAFFIENFGKVRHPTAGILPFKLFDYQKSSLLAYRQNRYNIYRKCRQCGISTLTGIYALWLALFQPHATILIVSKRDEDAKEFLNKNVKVPYDYLPDQFKAIYGDPPEIYSEHRIIFPNGSTIKSLTSSKNTIRANSSTLNIIDEAAFMPDMEEMWAGGQPTLIHGGSVIVISTCNGKGNWYHNTWEDSESQANEFNPIYIKWYEMDWTISYRDQYTGQILTISPTAGIRPTTEEERPRYGEFWSPWLEEQYRSLQQRGEAHLFPQEVLASFLGSGNTILEEETLLYIEAARKHDYKTVRFADYIHPVRGESLTLDFQDQLQVWQTPVRPTMDVIENGKIIKPGTPGHTYSIGVDISTGEASDYSGVEVLDTTAKEQVAELKIKVIPKILAMMVDYLGRWYNGALIVPESTGIGRPFIQELYNILGYANLYRMRKPNGKRDVKIGFPTTETYKANINKALMDMLGEDGYEIYSHRLYKELGIYIHLTQKKTGAEPGSGNHDDLVIGLGLALLGCADAIQMDVTAMIPTRGIGVTEPELVKRDVIEEQMKKYASIGGLGLLMPVTHSGTSETPDQSASRELERFTSQLGGLTKQQAMQFKLDRAGGVVMRKHTIKRGKYSR